MKWYVLLIIILSTCRYQVSIAQETDFLPKHSIEANLGMSWYSGYEQWGPVFNAKYTSYFSERFSFGLLLGGMVHDGVDHVSYWDNNGNSATGAVNYTVAGLQTGVVIGYSFVRSRHHQFKGSLGIIGRYESTSYPSAYGFATTFPIPGDFLARDPFPASEITMGGILSLSYDYTFNNGLFLGLEAILQPQSNDDAQYILFLTVGKRF